MRLRKVELPETLFLYINTSISGHDRDDRRRHVVRRRVVRQCDRKYLHAWNHGEYGVNLNAHAENHYDVHARNRDGHARNQIGDGDGAGCHIR